MVPVFSSSNHDAEMEAMTIAGVLESSGIPAQVVGPHVLGERVVLGGVAHPGPHLRFADGECCGAGDDQPTALAC